MGSLEKHLFLWNGMNKKVTTYFSACLSEKGENGEREKPPPERPAAPWEAQGTGRPHLWSPPPPRGS